MTTSTPRRTGAAILVVLLAGCGGGGQSTTPTQLPPSSAPPTTSSDPVPTTVGTTGVPTTDSPTSGPSTTDPPTTSTTTTKPTSTTSGPSTTTRDAKCAGKSLTIDSQQLDAGAGQTYWKLTFTNTGDQPCQIYGFPGADPFEGDRQVGAPAERSGEEPKTFSLAPKESIGARLRLAQVGNHGAACTPVNVTSLRVTAPNDTFTRTVPFQGRTCANTSIKPLNISPVLR